MRLPKTEHTDRPWRIHEVTGDFLLEDVWALPTPGGPDDLPYLVAQFAKDDGRGAHEESWIGRFLFAARWRLGKLFGWDKPDTGVGDRVRSLRERLPEDLRDADPGPGVGQMPFTPVLMTHDEWATEHANKTVHAVMHIGWVPDGKGGYRGQMAVLVKPNGLLGKVFLLGIKPFRFLGVYPAMFRAIGREWDANAAARKAG